MEQRTNSQMVAQLWCLPKHEKKQFDADLAVDMIALLDAKDSIIEGLRASLKTREEAIQSKNEVILRREKQVADLTAEVAKLRAEALPENLEDAINVLAMENLTLRGALEAIRDYKVCNCMHGCRCEPPHELSKRILSENQISQAVEELKGRLDKLKSAEAEIERLISRIRDFQKLESELQIKLLAGKRCAEALVKASESKHPSECKLWTKNIQKCTCGIESAIALAKEEGLV